MTPSAWEYAFNFSSVWYAEPVVIMVVYLGGTKLQNVGILSMEKLDCPFAYSFLQPPIAISHASLDIGQKKTLTMQRHVGVKEGRGLSTMR